MQQNFGGLNILILLKMFKIDLVKCIYSCKFKHFMHLSAENVVDILYLMSVLQNVLDVR